MSATSPCIPCCSEPQVTNVPGIEGDPGTNGADGLNAFTTTTGDFLIPSVGSNATISVVNSTWMAIGQKIVMDGPATFEVVSLPGATSVTAKFKGYTGDLSPGANISSGSKVSPAGTQPSLTSLSVYAAGTPYVLTAVSALLDFGTTDPSLTITSAGTWLILSRAKYDYNAATFASVRTVTTKLRRTNNTPADLTNGSSTWRTEIITTLTYTAMILDLQPLIYVTANSDDILQLWGDVSVVPTAGSLDAMEASIVAIKIS